MSIKKIMTTGLLLSTLGVAAQAQSLVYCSEGSPEGFDPALFDAWHLLRLLGVQHAIACRRYGSDTGGFGEYLH